MGRYEIFVTGAADAVDGWRVWCPELGVAGSGRTVEDAESVFVAAVVEYATDWVNGLGLAGEHRKHASFVRLVAACNGDLVQLRELLLDVEVHPRVAHSGAPAS